ncbi:hypothetical protein HID58_070390 [Brassica napus]|uniref:Uncharacterized protein n=1 Tax=Brassica napus TaxID=3708 RepID=A0ABQ7YYN9_BRANA|nr:hypothetical protein HID58_070390 [Brassica napus]
MSSKKKQKRSQKSPLPLQYRFVSKTTAPPVPNRRSPPGVSDYPPPRQLFQDSEAQTQAASGSLHQPSPPPQSRRSETSATRRSLSSSQAKTLRVQKVQKLWNRRSLMSRLVYSTNCYPSQTWALRYRSFLQPLSLEQHGN